MSRRLLTTFLSLGLLAGALGGVPVAAADPTPAPGFASPEDAVTAYLAGVRDADLDAVLASAAIEELAHGFDFAAYIDRLQAWPPIVAPAPATDPFLVGLDRAHFTAQLLGQTRMLIYSLLTTADLEGGPVAPVDAAWAQAFMEQLDLGRLHDLTVTEVRFPDHDLATNERYLAMAAKQAAVYGADELTERVAQVAFEGHDYLVGFTLMRFGQSWKVSSQSSALSGVSPTGAASPLPAS